MMSAIWTPWRRRAGLTVMLSPRRAPVEIADIAGRYAREASSLAADRSRDQPPWQVTSMTSPKTVMGT